MTVTVILFVNPTPNVLILLLLNSPAFPLTNPCYEQLVHKWMCYRIQSFSCFHVVMAGRSEAILFIYFPPPQHGGNYNYERSVLVRLKQLL